VPGDEDPQSVWRRRRSRYLMGYPTCPSCGHEIYDSSAVVCPFCGAGKGRRAIPTAGGGQSRKPGPAVFRALLAMALAGGVISFLSGRFDEESGKRTVEVVEVRDQTQDRVPDPLPEPMACSEQMRLILDAGLRMQTGIDEGTIGKQDLDRLEAATRGNCPETGETYLVDFAGRTVTVTCPSHGSISGEW
jgi:hypothetical protein